MATYWNLIRESRSFPLIRFPQIWAIKNPKNYNYFHIFLFLKFPEKNSKSPRPHKLFIIASNLCCGLFLLFFFGESIWVKKIFPSLPFCSLGRDAENQTDRKEGSCHIVCNMAGLASFWKTATQVWRFGRQTRRRKKSHGSTAFTCVHNWLNQHWLPNYHRPLKYALNRLLSLRT